MHYQPVVDQISPSIPLDPLFGMLFVALFVATALVTMRRASYGLALLLFITPFALYRDAFATTMTLPKVVLAGVIVGLLSYPGAIAYVRESDFRRIAIALSILAAVTLLTIVSALHPTPVLRETFKAVEHLALFAAAYIAYRLDPDDRLLFRAFCASVAVVALSALVQEALGAPSALVLGHTVVPRIAGVLEGPNQLGGYMELAIALMGAWAMARPGMLTAMGLVVAGCTAVLTFSRGAAVGIAIVLLILLLVRRDRWWSAGWPALTGLGLGGCAATGWGLVAHSFDFVRVASATDYAGGVGNRPELWRAAWAFFRMHPWLGIGAGNYQLELRRVGVYGVRTHANSWYLQALAEGGIALFSATIAFIVTTIATLRDHLRDAQPWVLGAFAATIALCVHQTVDYLIFYQKVGTPWMLAIGLGAAAIANRKHELSESAIISDS
ncbi:MAG: O-antigen ligase family protein [Vulcanimicrobiaceae bacterium]